jgi:apolipoprotein N-acyltransferase
MCYFVTVWHWFFVMYPLEFTGMDAGTALLVVLAAVLGIPLVQSSMFAFVFVIFCKLARGETAKRIPFLKPFLFAALWVVFEWTQTLFWFGVPWGRLAIGQTKLLVTLQSSSVLGSYFVSFLIVAVNSLVAAALLYASMRKLCALTCASVFAVNFIFGAVEMLPKKQNEQVTVAAIQGNISSVDKWNSSPQKAYDTYKRLTCEAAESGAQIVVWPESVLLSYSYLIPIIFFGVYCSCILSWTASEKSVATDFSALELALPRSVRPARGYNSQFHRKEVYIVITIIAKKSLFGNS